MIANDTTIHQRPTYVDVNNYYRSSCVHQQRTQPLTVYLAVMCPKGHNVEQMKQENDLSDLCTTFWNFGSSMLFIFVLVWLYKYLDMSVTDESYVDETRVWRTKL